MRAPGNARARDGAVSTAVQGARFEQWSASSCGPAAHELFISRLPLIDSVIRAVVVRHRLSSFDGEEFASIVHLRLMDNEHDILRRFQYRSSLRTFLMVVVQRLYLDFRNSQWGKWRPSAESRRQGSTAGLPRAAPWPGRLDRERGCRSLAHSLWPHCACPDARQRVRTPEGAAMPPTCVRGRHRRGTRFGAIARYLGRTK